MNINQARHLKRNRFKRISDPTDDYACGFVCRPNVDGHVPMKNESKVLRRLMSQTGLTEQQLRQHKKYRIMLSQAQKTNTGTYFDRKSKLCEQQLKRIFLYVMREFETTSMWDIRVQEKVLAILSGKYEWGYRDINHQHSLALFHTKYKRKDKK